MVEIKFTVDDNFSMDELKCVMAYIDFVCAIHDLRMLVKDYWEETPSDTALEKFVKDFNLIIADLPTLP